MIHISIGIPAYNEEANIQKLLRALLAQKEIGFSLKEIVVMLDGSTDGTYEQVRAVKDKRIKVVHDGKRLGKSERLNQLFAVFTGDVLVLMDADITIKDTLLLSKLVQKSTFEKDGLVAVNASPLPPKTYFEHIIDAGVSVMKDIAQNWRNGQNYLSFKGCFLALDKQLAKKLFLPGSLVNNDGFLYFAAREHGYTPRFLSELKVYYKSPTIFRDHLKQSSRYHGSKDELRQYFIFDQHEAYGIPLFIALRSTLRQFLLQPHYLLPYLILKLLTKQFGHQKQKSAWSIAASTK